MWIGRNGCFVWEWLTGLFLSVTFFDEGRIRDKNIMKKEHEAIISILSDYLTRNPEVRFGQALFNLNINQFHPKSNIESGMYLRDVFF